MKLLTRRNQHRSVPFAQLQLLSADRIVADASVFVQTRLLSKAMEPVSAAKGPQNRDQQILFIDAYDSFSESIGAMLQQTLNVTLVFIKVDVFIQSTSFMRIGEPRLLLYSEKRDFKSFLNRFDAIVIGPGPGDPANEKDIGIIPLVLAAARELYIPVLGICLGFQTLCLRAGLPVARLPVPCHGQVKRIIHTGKDIFDGVAAMVATNYHSLGVRCEAMRGRPRDKFEEQPDPALWSHRMLKEKAFYRVKERLETVRSHYHQQEQQGLRDGLGRIQQVIDDLDNELIEATEELEACGSKDPPEWGPESLTKLAWTDEGWLMAVRYKSRPVWGLQFHLESCKSSKLECEKIIEHWWRAAQPWNAKRREKATTYLACFDLPGDAPGTGISTSLITKTNAGRNIDPVKSLLAQMAANFNPSHYVMSTNKVLACMKRLAGPAGTKVLFSTSTLTCHPEKIAQLCVQQTAAKFTAILESTRKGRFNIYAMNSPDMWYFEAHADRVRLDSKADQRPAARVRFEGNPSVVHGRFDFPKVDTFGILLDFLDWCDVGGGPVGVPFWGGFLGYMSYELGLRQVRGDVPKGTVIPEAALLWVDRCIVVDTWEKKVYIQSIREGDELWVEGVTSVVAQLGPNADSIFIENMTRSFFNAAVEEVSVVRPDPKACRDKYEKCQAELRAGNSYELCLTTKAWVRFPTGLTFPLYRNLNYQNPAPFSAYLGYGDVQILSSSPEQFIKWDRDGVIDMVPMKGTVAKTPTMTLERAAAILASPKESAENLMIADLIRHDLYSALGSNADVEVVKLGEVVEYQSVYQLISHIRANPAPELKDLPLEGKAKRAAVLERGLSALKHSLPPGSMTGAPKKRSCEILLELERQERGVYSGVVGFLDVGGGGSFSVAIRTAFSHASQDVKGQKAWRVGAGGAITVLSEAESEWEEMEAKLDSVLRAFTTPME